MKTTLDIPEPIARRIGALAERDGRSVEQQILQVLHILLASDLAVAEWADIIERTKGGETPDIVILPHHGGGAMMFIEFKTSKRAEPLPEPVIAVDPTTGLPVIYSPPGAPIHRMTAAEFQSVVDQANEEADLGRAGLPLRR